MTPELRRLGFLLGEWAGEERGKAGTGTGERSYRTVLGRFIEFRSRTVYDPQERNPDGEVHEEVGIFSFDESTEDIILREFHSEGFVITYTLTVSSPDLVFESRAFENGPDGLQARLTLGRDGSDAFDELFELRPTGGDFDEYVRSRWVSRGSGARGTRRSRAGGRSGGSV